MKARIKTLAIGDSIYKATCTGLGYAIFRYKVVERRIRTESAQYVVECQACSDHEKCLVLVAPVTEDTFKFVNMINNDGFDGARDERSWHDTRDGVLYSLKKKKTATMCIKERVEWTKKEIEKSKEQIARYEKDLKDFALWVNSLKED